MKIILIKAKINDITSTTTIKSIILSVLFFIVKDLSIYEVLLAVIDKAPYIHLP